MSDHDGDRAGAPPDPVRIVLRPIGVPLPLGLSALAMGSFVVDAQELGWLGSASTLEIGLFLLAVVAPLQVISSILGFLSRDPIAGAGMALAAAGWIAQGFARVVPAPDAHFLGIAMLAVAGAMIVPCSSSWFGNRAVSLVLAGTALRFLLVALHSLTGAAGLEDAAGIVGLVVAALALYVAVASEFEAISSGPRLPIPRRGPAWESVEGGLDRQLRGLRHEAGVRKQI
jgi:succinate-acetate transporter protein